MRADHIVLLVVLVDDFAGGLHPTVLPGGLRAGQHPAVGHEANVSQLQHYNTLQYSSCVRKYHTYI